MESILMFLKILLLYCFWLHIFAICAICLSFDKLTCNQSATCIGILIFFIYKKYYILGKNLVPKPTNEAKEAYEGGSDPPRSHPDRRFISYSYQHLTPVPEQHRLQRLVGRSRPGRPQPGRSWQVWVPRTSVTQGWWVTWNSW